MWTLASSCSALFNKVCENTCTHWWLLKEISLDQYQLRVRTDIYISDVRMACLPHKVPIILISCFLDSQLNDQSSYFHSLSWGVSLSWVASLNPQGWYLESCNGLWLLAVRGRCSFTGVCDAHQGRVHLWRRLFTSEIKGRPAWCVRRPTLVYLHNMLYSAAANIFYSVLSSLFQCFSKHFVLLWQLPKAGRRQMANGLFLFTYSISGYGWDVTCGVLFSLFKGTEFHLWWIRGVHL